MMFPMNFQLDLIFCEYVPRIRATYANKFGGKNGKTKAEGRFNENCCGEVCIGRKEEKNECGREIMKKLMKVKMRRDVRRFRHSRAFSQGSERKIKTRKCTRRYQVKLKENRKLNGWDSLYACARAWSCNEKDSEKSERESYKSSS